MSHLLDSLLDAVRRAECRRNDEPVRIGFHADTLDAAPILAPAAEAPQPITPDEWRAAGAI